MIALFNNGKRFTNWTTDIEKIKIWTGEQFIYYIDFWKDYISCDLKTKKELLLENM